MERWLVVVLAGALWAGVGAGAAAARYAEYSAAQMPQYYDSHGHVRNAQIDESYRDHEPAADGTLPIDYNEDVGPNHDRSILKTPIEMDMLPVFDNPEKMPTTAIMDYGDSDYNYKPKKNSQRMRINAKNSNNRNKSKIKQIGVVTTRSKLSRNENDYQIRAIDDEDADMPSKQYEDEEVEELNSDHDRNRFVRRDIRQKDRQQLWQQRSTAASDSNYDDQGDGGHIKDTLRQTGREYPEPESPRNRPYPPPLLKPQSYNTAIDFDDESQSLSGKYRAPMPKQRKKPTEYVDYNDMNRIEKIKNLSGRRSTVRTGASQGQRWSYKDSLHRRNFNEPVQQTAKVTTTPNVITSTSTTANKTTLPIQIAGLSPEIIQNITAFINKSRHLSLAEKSQLSILKKAQRKDTAKDEMLKDKPPVLLQVTERLQTVVMVEPPVSQEPWLRARDISEDSPERIEKVKRFMRNKLVANARNVSELMEHWDDTVCDYVDISTLDKNTNSTETGSVKDQLQAALDQKDAAEDQNDAAVDKKDAAPAVTVLITAVTPEPLPTFKPDSADPSQNAQWNQFLVNTNHTTQQQPSIFVHLLTLILILTI